MGVRALISLAILASLALPTISTANAAIKNGGSCARVSATTTVNKVKFICILKNKKLVWAVVPNLAKYSDALIEKEVAADWAKWRANKLNETPKVIYRVEDGYSSDWVKYSETIINYTMNVLNGNGLKLVPTPWFAFGETEDWRKKIFDEAHCNAPYMPNMEMIIYCASVDLGSGGVRIGKPGISMKSDYKLRPRDIQQLTFVDANELGIFYEAQAQYGDIAYNGTLNQIPAWIRAGLAQSVGVMAANDVLNPGGSYGDFQRNSGVIGSKPNGLCDKDLQDYEGKNKMMSSYCTNSQNYFAVQLLIAKHGGFRALFNFPKYLGEEFDWPSDFKQAFGISREDFYREWYTYLGLREDQFPIIRAPTPAEHY